MSGCDKQLRFNNQRATTPNITDSQLAILKKCWAVRLHVSSWHFNVAITHG